MPRKSYNNRACKVWEATVELCNKTKMENLTLREKILLRKMMITRKNYKN